MRRKNVYIIKDENGEIMRIVGRQEEARHIVQQREGWTFKCVRKIVRKIVEGYKFEEALF
jgi:5-keto 4-deoxyuronate isomerase